MFIETKKFLTLCCLYTNINCGFNGGLILYFSDIICELKQRFKINLISDNSSNEVKFIHLLDGEEKQYKDNILYFSYGLTKDIPNKCISLDFIPKKLDDKSLATISRKDFFAAYNFVSNLISKNSKQKLFLDLDVLARKTTDISFFINQAAIALNNPLVVVDEDFKIAAYSTSMPPADSMWKDTVARGYCSYKLIKTIESNIASIVERNSNDAYLVEVLDVSSSPKIYSNIYINGNLWGVVIMFAERTPISNDDYNYLSWLSKLLEYIVPKSGILISKDMSYANSLLHRLLFGTGIDDLDQKSFNIDKNSKYCLLVVKTSKKSKSIQDIIESFSVFSNLLAYSSLRGVITFLVSIDRNNFYLDRQNDLISLAQDEDLNVGISNNFDDISFVRKAYGQCLFALNFSSYNNLSFYSDFYFANWVNAIKNSNFDYILNKNYLHPCISLLIDYDKKNKTELFRTLREYLENNSNIKETSNSLFLHRNSVKYRLDKIIDLCKVDLEDAETIFMLQFSIHIIKYKDVKFDNKQLK